MVTYTREYINKDVNSGFYIKMCLEYDSLHDVEINVLATRP